MDDSTGLHVLSGAGITIDTARAFLRYSHRAGVYCPQCQRWADLRLGELVMRGLGDRPLSSLPLRCRDCGAPGELQVKPPVPEWGGATWGVHHGISGGTSVDGTTTDANCR